MYRYLSTIVESRRIAKENSNSAGKIIYIHTEYLQKLFMQGDVKKQEEKEKRWAELDKRDELKAKAKEEKRKAKERERKRQALKAMAREAEKDAKVLEAYIEKYRKKKEKDENR